jgi:DNA-binding SARP family transcriptional activator
VLGGIEGVRITRGPGGYLLAADPLTVDLHLVRHLVSRARETDHPAEAATLYTRALDLWRGDPFPAIDVPWFADLRTAVEAERFAGTLDRNDAALDAGRQAEVLGEITAAAAAHPLDERLAGQLMLAQYRSDRQSDALATFQRIRRRLVDELGASRARTCARCSRRSSGPMLRPHVPQRVAGAAAVPEDHPLQRRFQDLRTAAAHIQAAPSVFELTGGLLLGADVPPSVLR